MSLGLSTASIAHNHSLLAKTVSSEPARSRRRPKIALGCCIALNRAARRTCCGLEGSEATSPRSFCVSLLLLLGPRSTASCPQTCFRGVQTVQDPARGQPQRCQSDAATLARTAVIFARGSCDLTAAVFRPYWSGPPAPAQVERSITARVASVSAAHALRRSGAAPAVEGCGRPATARRAPAPRTKGWR